MLTEILQLKVAGFSERIFKSNSASLVLIKSLRIWRRSEMIFPPCLSAGMRIADRREGRYTSLEFEFFMELPKIFSKTRNHSLGHPL